MVGSGLVCIGSSHDTGNLLSSDGCKWRDFLLRVRRRFYHRVYDHLTNFKLVKDDRKTVRRKMMLDFSDALPIILGYLGIRRIQFFGVIS